MMQTSNRLSVVISLILLGLAFSSVFDLPTRTFDLVVLGSPLTLTISGPWLMALLLGGLACTGTEAIVRSHPNLHLREVPHTFVFWILPGLLTAEAVFLLPSPSASRPLWLMGLGVTGLLLGLVLIGQYRIVDPADPWYGVARLGLNLVTYMVAFTLLATIYGARVRSLLSATAVFLVADLLALVLLRGGEGKARRTWLYAALVGFITSQATWALNYWRLGGLAGGVLLLWILYLATGLAQQSIQATLRRGRLIEFASVALVGLSLLFLFGFGE